MDRITIPLFAILGVLPFYIPQTWFLEFFAFLPLFVRKDFLSHIRFGFIYGFLLYLFLLKALLLLTNNVFLIILLFLIFSSTYALLQFGIPYLLSRLGIFYPLAFVLVEILRLKFPFNGFPYEYLGKIAVNIPFFNLSLHYITVFGATFVILSINWIIFKIFEDWERGIKKHILLLGGIISILLILSVAYRFSLKIPNYGLRIAIVQPFLEEEDKIQNEDFVKLYTAHLLNSIPSDQTDLVFLPETAISGDDYKNFVKTFSNYNLIFGASALSYNRKSEKWIAKNLVVFSVKGEIKGIYEKEIPLPFGEYTPTGFRWLAHYIPYLGYVDYERGHKRVVFRFKNLKILPRICNEVFYPLRGLKGINLVVVVSNDAWFGFNFSQRHLWEVRLRAIETGKIFIFVNNNGYSGIVLPDGSYIGKPFDRVQLLSL